MEFGAPSSRVLSGNKFTCSSLVSSTSTTRTHKVSVHPTRLYQHQQQQRFSNACFQISRRESALKKVVKMSKDDSREYELSSLTALSPLDGRYWDKVKDLAPYMSEYGLIYFRVLVEIKWLLKLSQIPEVTEVPNFSEEAQCFLQGLIDGFSMDDALEVKNIEKVTDHDVKAVEYFLKQKCQSQPEIAKVLRFFHFACTSEDIDNLARALMLKEAINRVMFPVMDKLIMALRTLAAKDNVSMLSRTHGQPASATTLGMEMSFFAVRLSEQRQAISQAEISGHFGGAGGNYCVHVAAYPEINYWPQIAEEFVTSLGLSFDLYVGQKPRNDRMATLFVQFIFFNRILIAFDRVLGGDISLAYFEHITKAGEIGSLTMLHEVNPIDFENSEGNLDKANEDLSPSHWQFDLAESTVLAHMGGGLGHSLLAYKSALQGIGKLLDLF